jgi:hypothetical protein
MIVFHTDGSRPSEDMIFVFGSNLAGIHGAGAARAATDYYGAEMGVGFGPTGNSYAIPTKDMKIKTLPLEEIQPYIEGFVKMTERLHEEDRMINGDRINPLFFVTRVGCGLAGYRDRDIAPFFKGAVRCSFAEQWKPFLVSK